VAESNGKFGRPDANSVREFHVNSDTDTSGDALHHTLGPGVNQASPGGHIHDGNDSAFLLEGITITGAKGSAACDGSIIAALMRLGATDSTT
jgi:hypothetical protein